MEKNIKYYITDELYECFKQMLLSKDKNDLTYLEGILKNYNNKQNKNKIIKLFGELKFLQIKQTEPSIRKYNNYTYFQFKSGINHNHIYYYYKTGDFEYLTQFIEELKNTKYDITQ